MEEKSPIFAAMPITNKLPHILNLDFDNDEVIKLSCSFVKNIYTLPKVQSSQHRFFC